MAKKLANLKKIRFYFMFKVAKINFKINYNLLGYYEGKNIGILDNYFEKFF